MGGSLWLCGATAALLLAGCGGQDGGSSSASTSATASRCESVSQAVVDTIVSQPKSVQMTPVKSTAVKSTDFKQVWMVAISFTAPGVEDPETGVWAVNSIDKPDLVTSVDGFAKEFTTWKDASERGVSQSDDGVEEARDCVS